MAASSLIELLFVLGVAATLVSTGVAQWTTSVDSIRASAAARHVVARLQQVRVRAITRNRATGLRISTDPRGFILSSYEDGNDNGVLAADISSGADLRIAPDERLSDQYPGVDFGTLPGLPGADGSAAPGTDPIRVGASDAVTFTPNGTATSGSLYIRGRGQRQFVVRIYGETGRTRVLEYSIRQSLWVSR